MLENTFIHLPGIGLKKERNLWNSGIRRPTLIIHLQCDAKEEMKRIRARARREEMNIQVAYLRELNEAIEKEVNNVSQHTALITIDSAELNFANDVVVQRRVVDDILTIVPA